MTVLFFQSLEEQKTHSSSVWHLMQQITSSVIAGRRFLKAGSLQLCCLFSPCEGSVANSCDGSVLCLLCLRDSTIYTKPKKVKPGLTAEISKMEAFCMLLSADSYVDLSRATDLHLHSFLHSQKKSMLFHKKTTTTKKWCSVFFSLHSQFHVAVSMVLWVVLFFSLHIEMSAFSA